MAESIDALPRTRGKRSRRAEPPARAARRPAPPPAGDQCPRWLREALARRGLQPSADRPVHRLLRERDLPEDVEEHEKVSVGTEHHALERELEDGLRWRYRDRPDVFVASDLLVYFDDPEADLAAVERLAPDLMVAFDVPKQARRTYPVWEVRKPPDFVLEILSPSTREKDVLVKPGLYRQMGAREYFLFDPTGRFEPRLRGWRFNPEGDTELPLGVPAAGMRSLLSDVLGLHLCHTHPWPTIDHHQPGAGKLRWHDPATGEFLETADEVEQDRAAQARRADAAEQRAAEEAAARRLLEKKVAALQARLG